MSDWTEAEYKALLTAKDTPDENRTYTSFGKKDTHEIDWRDIEG